MYSPSFSERYRERVQSVPHVSQAKVVGFGKDADADAEAILPASSAETALDVREVEW